MVEYFAYNEKVNGSNPLLPFRHHYVLGSKVSFIIYKSFENSNFLLQYSKIKKSTQIAHKILELEQL